MYEVHVTARSVEPFAEILGNERVRALEREAQALRGLLGQRTVWNVNTAASGGGVAEMLRSFLRYARGLDIDVRWLVFEGPPEFFRITKRVHNALHGSAGTARRSVPNRPPCTSDVSSENAVALDAVVSPGDVVVCHDPQTAALVTHLVARGIQVVWRCHIGHDRTTRRSIAAGLPPSYLENVPIAVFSRAAYAPAWLHGKRTIVLPPTIDPFSAKNRPMTSRRSGPSSPTRVSSTGRPGPRLRRSFATTAARAG